MRTINLTSLKKSIHLDQLITVNGQAGQDLFVIAMLDGKVHGKWLELGCGSPFHENNTLILEKQFGWSGTSIDINGSAIMHDEVTLADEWKEGRPGATFLSMDALEYDFSSGPSRIDYLQIDIDDPLVAFKLLKKFTERSRFSVMTFEHDYWVKLHNKQPHPGNIIRHEVRNYLQSMGYVLLVADVVIDPNDPARNEELIGQPVYFEDWWVDPKIVPSDIIETYKWAESLIPDKYWTKILLKQ